MDKSINLVKQDRFQEALTECESSKIKCYCLYRLGRFNEVLSEDDESLAVKHIKAQSLYKLQRYSEALDIYNSIADTDERLDIYVNLLACWANNTQSDIPHSSMQSFEEKFNYSCGLLNEKRYIDAISLLKETLASLDNEQEEDILIVQLQLAHALYCNGNVDEYSNFLSSVSSTDSDRLKYALDFIDLLAKYNSSNNIYYVDDFLYRRPQDMSGLMQKSLKNNIFLSNMKSGRSIKGLSFPTWLKSDLSTLESIDDKIRQKDKSVLNDLEKISLSHKDLLDNEEFLVFTLLLHKHLGNQKAAKRIACDYLETEKPNLLRLALSILLQDWSVESREKIAGALEQQHGFQSLQYYAIRLATKAESNDNEFFQQFQQVCTASLDLDALEAAGIPA